LLRLFSNSSEGHHAGFGKIVLTLQTKDFCDQAHAFDADITDIPK